MTAAPSAGAVDAVPFLDGLLVHQRHLRTVHVLNASAAAVWEAAQATGDADAAAGLVASRFGVAPADIAPDVHRSLEDLRRAELLAPWAATEAPVAPSVPPPPRGTPGGAPPPPPGVVRRVVRSLHRTAVVTGPSTAVDGLGPLLAELELPVGATATGPAPVVELALHPTADDGRWELWEGDRLVHGPGTLAAARSHLLWRLNHDAIAEEAALLLLHAGGAATDQGVIGVAGEPDAGKSTLTAALCLDGAAYVTDEALALDPADQRVVPYPKPLTLDLASLDLLGLPHEVASTGHVAPGALGAVARRPAPLAVVVLPDRTGGAPRTPAPLDPAAAALALAGVAFNLPAVGPPGLALLAHLAVTVPVVPAHVDDPRAAARAVRALAADLAGGRATDAAGPAR